MFWLISFAVFLLGLALLSWGYDYGPKIKKRATSAVQRWCSSGNTITTKNI